MTPKLSPPLDIHALVYFSPTLFLGWPVVLLCCFQGQDIESTVASSLLSLLNHWLLGKSDAMLWRVEKSYREAHIVKWELANRFSSLSQAYRWLQTWSTSWVPLYERPWDKITQLNPWHRYFKVINTCNFKLPKFEDNLLYSNWELIQDVSPCLKGT